MREPARFCPIFSGTDDIVTSLAISIPGIIGTIHALFPDFSAVEKFQLFIFGILFLQIYFLAHACMYCVNVLHFILRFIDGAIYP